MSDQQVFAAPDERFKRRLDESFVDDGQLLLDDVINNTLGLEYWADKYEFEKLYKVETYEGYLRRAWPRPGQADEIIRRSDAATVAEYDALISAFNADLERIRSKRDKQAVLDFSNGIRKLLERRKI